MNKLTEWLTEELINEDIKLDVKVGDTVLMGRFKNKRVVVKSIDFNEKGDMMINGRSALKFRIVKAKKALLPVSRTDKDSATQDGDMKGVKESKELRLNIPNDIKKIHRLFKKNGKKLYVVGGAVRDAVLGKSPKDFDLATDAKPEEIKKIAEKGKLSTSGTVGEKFGVVVVGGHEIATFRKDIGKGRRPTAVDYTDIEGDVRRRDLTINALFYDMDRSEIVDLVGGIEDLKKKKIRTVGKASDRFDEDPLRKLRALRFHGALGGKMSTDTKQALKDDPSLKGVSGERIRDEFVKSIRKAKSTKNYLQKSDEFKFTKLILPGITVSKPYIDENDHILFLAWILRKNDASSLGGKLNKLKYSRDEAQNIQFLNTLQSFEPEKIFLTKKFQERTSLTDDQIIQWGKYIGKDLKKMVNFKLSVKGSDVSKDVKGKDIGKAIQKMEFNKFLNEKVDYEIKNIYKLLIKYGNSAKKASDILKKHYKYVAKKYARSDIRDKTVALIGLAGLNEIVPSPSRKGVEKMKKKGNTSVPYGSGYKKVNEDGKEISDKNYAQWKKSNKLKKQENVEKTLDLYMKNVVYSIMENTQITKVIGIYGGRFQPFGPHHLKTYQWLESRVDEAYITTSDIKKPPRHPMNFAEKVRHMVKMGVPKNRIVKEATPYVAKNTLNKFDPNTTAVVYIFGKKDAGRLQGGTKKSGGKTYYQDYKQNKDNLVGFEEHGYILTAPHTSMSVAGMEISGTTMRKVLGSPKIKDEDRPKIFKKLFGYYDKGVYNMMTNKFKKLFEFMTNIKPLLKEVSAFNSSFKGSSLSDEGFYDFFKTFKDYKRVSPKHAEILGWSVIGDILGKNATSSRFDDLLKVPGMGGAVDTVTFGKTVNQNTKNTKSVSNPFKKHEKYMRAIIKNMGWEVVKFMGSKTVDIEDSELMDMMKVLSSAEREKILKEQKELLLMGGAYGHMSHPFDDNDLTFGDLKNIITLGLGGKLDREDGVTEKLDGQNLMICWIDGELKAARNKGHLKNKGATAPNTNGIKKIFAGRGNVEKAFVSAMTDLSRAIKKLSDAQKEKIFGNGTKWMNLEIMYPATANVVDYDVAEIIFHGTLEYDDSGKPIGQPKDSARMLAGMIKQVNANVQKTFKIGKPNFLKVPKTQNFGKKKSKFLSKLDKFKGDYNLSDSDRLSDYHVMYWQEWIMNGAKQTDYPNISNDVLLNLTRRWAFFDKSYKIPNIKSDLEDYPKFLEWVLSTDKNDHAKIFKQNIQPIETLFFEVGAEILKNISGYMAVNPDRTVQLMKKEVEVALKDLKSGGNPEKLKKLKLQIEKLEAIGGVNAIVPSEGVVFKYKGKVYKFTGAFAPINQILGSLKFG